MSKVVNLPVKPVAVVHCYNISASCIDNLASVTTATHDAPASAASARAAQLHALLCVASESMECLPVDARGHLLALANDMACEIHALCKLATEVE